MSGFFDGKHVLNMTDMNGQKPELFIICSRVRGPGKTFWFTRKLVDDYFKNGGKFVVFTRNIQDIGHVAEGMFKESVTTTWPGYTVTETTGLKGAFSNIVLEHTVGEDTKKEACGYVVALSAADKIKRTSSIFVDSVQGIFDEFQPETGRYLRDEVDKFLSIHTSIARGGGKSRRYFPVYMLSNTVSITNDYFLQLGLTSKLQASTRKYRGDGFVYYRYESSDISNQHAAAGMARAFKGNKSIDFSDDQWLLDDSTGVTKPDGWGLSYYVATFINGDRRYGLRFYPGMNLYYVTHSVDQTSKAVYVCRINGENNPAFRGSQAWKLLKGALEKGQTRFDSAESKRATLSML